MIVVVSCCCKPTEHTLRSTLELCLWILSMFWAAVCKTVRPMPCDRCLSCPVCLSVCNVGVLWPNGWMDHDATWYGDRRHCVRWGPIPPHRKGHSSHPLFNPCILRTNGPPSHQLLSSFCYTVYASFAVST